MKIYLVGAWLFHVEGRHLTNLIVAFCNFVNVLCSMLLQLTSKLFMIFKVTYIFITAIA
jgi:hypothetical protein